MDEIVLKTDHLHLLTREQAWHYRILPKAGDQQNLTVYCESGQLTAKLSAELEILLGRSVALEPLPPETVARLLSTYYLKEDQGEAAPMSLAKLDSDDFLIRLIEEAKNLKSSDIHVERYEHKHRVRIRIDGMLVERYRLKKEDYPALINKIKIMANLDIAEKRLPQDGRINFNKNGCQFDIRTSILPTLYGEKAVLRILNNDATNIDLNQLGFFEMDLENYLQGARQPNGMLLISGPTGSGKTTTLYATLKLLNKETRNVLTIEDPVEYTLEGINQVQLKESIGMNFAAALRTFLRQDPDVIMVGEIRDVETAQMAIRAAQTGHLVLSTIHTNSAWGTVSRLIEMGIPPYLVAGTLNTTVAQRLVRLLCPLCKSQTDFDEHLYPKQFSAYYTVSRHFKSKGCEACYYTGYKGRKAVYEVIPLDRELAIAIKNENMYIEGLLKERGIRTLAENAFDLFAQGQTSLEEIYPLLLNY